MIRFFVRLAIAALVDWLTWQISTPEMRFERITRKHMRKLLRAIEAASPAVEEFCLVMRRIAGEFAAWAEVNRTLGLKEEEE